MGKVPFREPIIHFPNPATAQYMNYHASNRLILSIRIFFFNAILIANEHTIFKNYEHEYFMYECGKEGVESKRKSPTDAADVTDLKRDGSNMFKGIGIWSVMQMFHNYNQFCTSKQKIVP